jgi:hypothetical protein
MLAVMMFGAGRGARAQLTGTWVGGDGTVYHVREAGRVVWWAGLSAESKLGAADFHRGYRFTNAFRGVRSGDTIRGEWTDVRRSTGAFGHGTLTIVVRADGGLARVRATGSSFPSSAWTRVTLPPNSSMLERFDRVLRNDTASMHSHLRMYKDYASVTGVVPKPIDPSILATATRSYPNFLCDTRGDFGVRDNDGDLSFDIVLDSADRARLTAQRGFWTDGWRNPFNEIVAKLENKSSWKIESEIVMYGRPTAHCSGDAAPLLPGWMERGGNGVLLNGVPIAGAAGVTGLPENGLLNGVLLRGRRVRVTGALAIDCHSGVCDEGKPEHHNVELHPVFSVDIFGDTNETSHTLAGVWDGTDGGTYYVRQYGTAVWWTGVSVDLGESRLTVFRGTLRGSTLTGEYSDLPVRTWTPSRDPLMGDTITVDAPRGDASTVLRNQSRRGFGLFEWNKIRP